MMELGRRGIAVEGGNMARWRKREWIVAGIVILGGLILLECARSTATI